MTKSKPHGDEITVEEFMAAEPPDTVPAPAEAEPYPLDADGNPPPGAFLEGYRSALDNPAHLLHHLRNT